MNLTEEETMMRELTSEEEKYLIKYCTESKKNTWLALAIGQVIPTIERRILSSFLDKLNQSVKKEIESRDDLRWRTCIPKKDLKEEDLREKLTILFVMTMEDRGVEIHLGLSEWNSGQRELYMGTHKKRENKKVYWPAGLLGGFLKRRDIGNADTVNGISRHWRFHPTGCHRYINTIKALNTLNDDPKIKCFTAQLVCFAEAISRELGE